MARALAAAEADLGNKVDEDGPGSAKEEDEDEPTELVSEEIRWNDPGAGNIVMSCRIDGTAKEFDEEEAAGLTDVFEREDEDEEEEEVRKGGIGGGFIVIYV